MIKTGLDWWTFTKSKAYEPSWLLYKMLSPCDPSQFGTLLAGVGRVWEADTLSCCQTHTDCELLGGGGWFSCRRGGGLWQPEICLPYEWLYSFLILCLRLIIWWREVSLFMTPLCLFSRWSALLKGLPSQMHLLLLKMKPRSCPGMATSFRP